MSAAEHGRQPIDFTNARDVATIIFKYKYTILITFFVIFIGVTIYAFQVPRPYEAKSVLLVKLGREFLQRPEEPRSGSGPSIPPQAILNGEIRILTSRDVLTKVVESVGPENLYPELSGIPKEGAHRTQAAVRRLGQSLNAMNLPGSNLIELTFVHNDAAMSAKVLNVAVDFFKEKHVEVFSGTGTPFLENQLRASQMKLTSAEKELAGFKQKYGVFSFEEQRSGLISQRNAVDASLRAAQNQISELQQRAAWIQGPGWSPGSSLEMRMPLAALDQRERELLEKFSPTSRTIETVRQQREIVKGSIQANINELRQAELKKIEGDLSVVKARTESLNRQSRQLEGEIQILDAHGRALQDLRREAAAQEQSYQAYNRKLEESTIMDDMDRRKMVAISVVENASAASTQKKQRFSREQMVTAGFFGGILGGVAIALLLEVMASGMTLPHSAERRLGLPVMVAITRKSSVQGW